MATYLASGDIHGCLEQLRRKLWHCRLIRGEIYLSQWETLSIVGRKFTLSAVTGTTLGSCGKRQS